MIGVVTWPPSVAPINYLKVAKWQSQLYLWKYVCVIQGVKMFDEV